MTARTTFFATPELLRRHGCTVREPEIKRRRRGSSRDAMAFTPAEIVSRLDLVRASKVPLVVDVESALKAVCDAYELLPETLLGKDRTPKPNHARMLLYWIFVRVYGMSLSATGRALNRTHGTVDNGVLRFEAWIKKDPEHTGKIAEHFRRVLQPKEQSNR